ncbi:MAG: DUF5684 domain-containing protein [Ruminococcus sp.]|nr:DUF5684 domain-containing protein [Ruminococcus sp.]
MSTNEGMALAGLGVFFVIIFGFIMLIALVIVIVNFVAMWKLFEKAGEAGWKAIIPIYNTIIMSKIATGNYKLGIASLCCSLGYSVCMGIANTLNAIASSGSDSSLAILSLISLPLSLLSMVLSLGMAVLNGYFHYIFTESYGKETIWCVLSIFFGPIVFLIMGFDKNTYYVGPKNHIKWFE